MAGHIADRWRVRDSEGKAIPSRHDGQGARWRARYVDPNGREQNRRFTRKVDAQQWLDSQTAGLVRGDHVDHRAARMTVEQWCGTWFGGYSTRRASTVQQARVHVRQIVKAFGSAKLADVKPSDVKAWTASLKAEGLAPSYVYALHRRLAQIMGDAVHDGIIPRSPCSRRTSPGAASQRAYVATTEQVWALHDAMPHEHLATAVLLGAVVGLRTSEVAALRVADVDFMRGIVSPAIQWPGEPLKSETSRMAVPIPQELALRLSREVARHQGATVVADQYGQPCAPWRIERAIRSARSEVDGLPEGFRFHDLRHYFASLLIASGLDVKVVQARMRHASATTTLNVYGHLFPDSDESSRAAIGAMMRSRGTDTFTDTRAL